MAEPSNADELKKKFAAALGAKKAHDNDPNGTGDNASSNARQSHGPVDPKRVFRRKSG